MSCGCGQTTPTTPPATDPCSTTGCIVQLDFACAIYNKDNAEASKLTALGLSNGATLKAVAEAIDTFIGTQKVTSFSLPFLKSQTTVETLKQFCEAVDSYLQASPVAGYLGNVASDPTSPLDGQYWFNATSGELKIKVNGVIKTIQTV
jgi:hypothetical protein